MAVCNFPLPTFEQFQCAASGMLTQYRTGTWDRGNTVAYLVILLGFLAGNFVPGGTLSLTANPTEQEVMDALDLVATAAPGAAIQIPHEILIPALLRLFERLFEI